MHGSDNIMIGDGTSLPINHTGSTFLPSSTRNFSLTNVLHVSKMKTNNNNNK